LARSPRLRSLRQRHPRLWSYLVARFARGEYLALHLLFGLLISVAVLALFGAIAEDVAEGAPLTPFDIGVARRLRTMVPSGWIGPLRAVSYAGSPIALAALLGIVAVTLAARRKWIALGAWVASFVGADLLDLTLKLIVRRGAVLSSGGFLHGQTVAFPSGHALGALVGYGMLAHLLATSIRGTVARTVVVGSATMLVVGIAASRLYLGTHYFSDTTAGLAAGLTWLTACITGLELAKRHRGARGGAARPLAA
jgi:undecaprenyl-diphosphatase